MMKKTASLLGIAVLGGVLTLGGYKVFLEKPQVIIERTVEPTQKIVQANYTEANNVVANTPTNFTKAAEKTIHAVVHVKNTAIKTQTNPYADIILVEEVEQESTSKLELEVVLSFLQMDILLPTIM